MPKGYKRRPRGVGVGYGVRSTLGELCTHPVKKMTKPIMQYFLK